MELWETVAPSNSQQWSYEGQLSKKKKNEEEIICRDSPCKKNIDSCKIEEEIICRDSPCK